MPNPEKKTEIISLRFRPSELKHLDAQASSVNLPRSTYITRKVQGLPVLPATVPAINWQLYGELATIASELPRLGNNINQIAAALNTAVKLGQPLPSALPNPESLVETLNLIKETQTLLKKVGLELSGVKSKK